MINEELWKAVLTEMELSLSRANFTTWFKGTSLLAYNNGSVLVSVPNGFVKEWLENKFGKQILQVIRNLQPDVREVKYAVGGIRIGLAIQKRDFAQLLPEKNTDEKSDADIDKTTNLNKRYTFGSFVVGSNNELAHAASLAITKNLGKTYNPLFIYGGVGLGKTHLLQATGNQIGLSYPDKKVCYISSERLTADIIESLKNKTIEEMKQRYAKLDLLIIDDIQFIAGKERTQDIFFSTFNELYGKNKQIVLSSDRPPSAIPALEERLRSRFEGGMIADIGIPDYETRLAILNMKCKDKNFEVDQNSLAYIASNIQKNIRELEGALNRIRAFSQIYNKVPDFKEVKKLLAAYLNTPYRKTTHQSILKSVADFYSIPITDLIKRSRKKEIVRPRQIAMFLLREETKSSFPEIGSKLGGRDHSTVIHAYEKIKKEEENEEVTKQELTLIKERIYQTFENS
ncbi:MAG: chromosomal replication initiator protein DnaA [Candidatus Yanofskybacteria bacterium]|nr:chromosomal replication initiator protein DnaA [Candidatus Yanofskybacteria bacterium]